MKNKVFTYILGCAVVLVWGMVIFKVIEVVRGDDEPQYVVNHAVDTTPVKDYAISRDTVHLLLNYRDPFTENKAEPIENPTEPMTEIKAPVKLKPVINWSGIRYSGFIHNPGSKKLVAMISINGKALMMTEGETAEQLKLLKNAKDSIKVTYQGATKFIGLSKL